MGKRICDELEKPRTLLSICKESWAPARSTVYKWVHDIPDFSDMYAIAKELQADAYVEEIIEIADTKDADTVCDEYGNPKPNHEYIARSRLRVDTRKWFAAKVLPKRYGEKIIPVEAFNQVFELVKKDLTSENRIEPDPL